MKVLGIISEYNPFHSGHFYHINESKRELDADYCIVLMSGDFVQRGEPAIMDKYARARIALNCGADLVLELPACFSTASAELFASGAIAIMDKLRIIDNISFGSEAGDLAPLFDIADVLIDEPEEFREALNHNLRCGRSFPFSRNLALTSYFKDKPDYMGVLSAPNNILAIEYIKAIKKRGSKIQPYTMPRRGAGYLESRFVSGGLRNGNTAYPSALSLRTALASGMDLEVIKDQMPEAAFNIMKERAEAGYFPLYVSDFSSLLHYKLLELENTGYEQFADVSPELSKRIKNKLREYMDYESFCNLLKTKDVTYARVCRALMHILLGITKQQYNECKSRDFISYASVLGFKKNASSLLSEIKKNSLIPLVSKTADAPEIISCFDLGIFNGNILASHIYQAVLMDKYGCNPKSPYKISPVII